MSDALRGLIVDDEPPARRVLMRLLADIPDIEVTGTAENGMEALSALAGGDIDVLFLDIEMPVLAGLELVTRLQPAPTPAVIFVTAWPQYAVAAFDVDAADYLLKPVDPVRLAAAVARARQRLTKPPLDASLHVLRSRQPTENLLDHVWVEHGGTRLRLSLADIEWFAADGDYVCAHTAERGYLMRASLNALESTLPPARFLRIHRSTIVKVDAVSRVVSNSSQLSLITRSGTTLHVGRRARRRVRQSLSG
jgi:DNA-binding LytR/AlgR family response regulator